jgi:hypothetical protein
MLKKISEMGLALVLPFMLRKSDKHHDYIADMWAWQHKQLDGYRSRPYSELLSLPETTPLSSPEKFKKFRFALCRRTGENGGVEISVRHYQQFLLVFSAGTGNGFEKLQNGMIVEEAEESPED